jgi:hypothetical protein
MWTCHFLHGAMAWTAPSSKCGFAAGYFTVRLADYETRGLRWGRHFRLDTKNEIRRNSRCPQRPNHTMVLRSSSNSSRDDWEIG